VTANLVHFRLVQDEVTVGSCRSVASVDGDHLRLAAALETVMLEIPGPTLDKRPVSGRRAVALPRVLVATVVSVASDSGVGRDVLRRSLQSRVHWCDGHSP
jgi:hypothetical protein